jgi:hypothetical protein
MLTNTAAASPQDAEITAITIAIDEAERNCRAALRDIARLSDRGEISHSEAAELEADALARLTAHGRDLELHGKQAIAPLQWAAYEERAARQRAAVLADRRRSPRLRGLSPRVRALRERQMCVVATAHVTREILGGLALDDDEESLLMRGQLAAAGLL